ncbi:Crp/Fnr family transcriptional regulator [uncultured Mucilaginibacter sp.]|uniref:Crp/Fnr family transcriptional regulator n=1 Tax=uncultured Mucilaginibacter sp. TaxID=797541 RepID=UPI0025CFB5CC|nr:Crp/Fnr family transcriptional regulator [uncultured Mucilaginibacter sp.]
MSLSGIFPIERWNFTTQSMLNVLSDEDFKYLVSHQSDQEYHKGEVIFREGTVPAGIFIVKKGKVKKYKTDRGGKEQIIYVANEGELIGYHAVLSGERYPDSAAALETSLLSFIPAEDFMEVLNRSPNFTHRLLKALSHEFTVLTNSISVFAQRTATERLAIALIVLREKFKDVNAEKKDTDLNISRADLANMAGIAQENVIRLLKEFKDEGILSTEGRKIRILDIQSLVKKSNYR